MGWLSPWIAGWLNLRVMLVYSPDSFLLKPGYALLVIGFALACTLAFGPRMVAHIHRRIDGELEELHPELVARPRVEMDAQHHKPTRIALEEVMVPFVAMSREDI